MDRGPEVGAWEPARGDGKGVGGRRGGRIQTEPRKVAVSEKRKILLIDDSEITLAMEKAVLEARGYEVATTS